MIDNTTNQRITRLTPLGDVLALIERHVGAMLAHRSELAAAMGRTLAADVVVTSRPPQPIALRDGFAVAAATVADAGPYAPVPLLPAPSRIDVGEPLPAGTDAVAPLDAVTVRDGHAEAVAAVAPGDGVLPAGGDAASQTPLRRAGERLRMIDIAIIAAAGIDQVLIRVPRVRIVAAGAGRAPLLDAALDNLLRTVTDAGGKVRDGRDDRMTLDAALEDPDSDAVIAVGGTGSGRRDDSVRALARAGRVEVHGIAVSPGKTAAFGLVGGRPALLVPGRIDAVLAIWLLVGRHLVAKLAGGSVDEAAMTLPLKRKVTSSIGLVELVPVRCAEGMAEPLASGYLSFQSLARSDGWIVVPADSEGFAAATPVAVRSWR